MEEDGPRRANIELKARFPDREKGVAVCDRLGARFVHTEIQTDSYFSVGSYRLKLRESSLGQHWLIGYSRPNEAGSRKSSYRIVPISDPAAKGRLLSRAMGLKAQIRKERTLYLLGPVRIHLDRVGDLGGFLEFEAVIGDDLTEAEGHARIAELRREFSIPEEDLVAGSYSDLVATGSTEGSWR